MPVDFPPPQDMWRPPREHDRLNDSVFVYGRSDEEMGNPRIITVGDQDHHITPDEGDRIDNLIAMPQCPCGTVGCIQDPQLRRLSVPGRAYVLDKGPWRERAEALQSEAPVTYGTWSPTDPLVNLHMVIPAFLRTNNVCSYSDYLRSRVDDLDHYLLHRHGVRYGLDLGAIEVSDSARWDSFSSVARSLAPNTKRSLLPGDPPPRKLYPSTRDFTNFLRSTHMVVGTPPVYHGDLDALACGRVLHDSSEVFLATMDDMAGAIPSQVTLLCVSAQAYFTMGTVIDRDSFIPLTVTMGCDDDNAVVVVFSDASGLRQGAPISISLPYFSSNQLWRPGTYHLDLGWVRAAAGTLHAPLCEGGM